MGRRIKPLHLGANDREELFKLASRGGRLRLRAQIILILSLGISQRAVAEELKVSVQMVSTWAVRYRQGGVAALADAPRSGRPPIPPSVVSEVCSAQLGQIAHAAQRAGIHRSTAHRLRKENPELVPAADLYHYNHPFTQWFDEFERRQALPKRKYVVSKK